MSCPYKKINKAYKNVTGQISPRVHVEMIPTNKGNVQVVMVEKGGPINYSRLREPGINNKIFNRLGHNNMTKYHYKTFYAQKLPKTYSVHHINTSNKIQKSKMSKLFAKSKKEADQKRKSVACPFKRAEKRKLSPKKDKTPSPKKKTPPKRSTKVISPKQKSPPKEVNDIKKLQATNHALNKYVYNKKTNQMYQVRPRKIGGVQSRSFYKVPKKQSNFMSFNI
mgnify:CR=1 FL=1|tara:strand:+ start:681 stop:1349 length:669 start_codon:yes stop_codon:yes gene_type:complete